jgi:hypothetical protein
MAPEAVTKRRYSIKSDVWSFGVTLWELCTGELPFSGIEPIRIAVMVAKGTTLPIPDYVPSDLASVLHSCWRLNPEERPTFDELYERLNGAGLWKSVVAAKSAHSTPSRSNTPSAPTETVESSSRVSLAVSPMHHRSAQVSPSASESASLVVSPVPRRSAPVSPTPTSESEDERPDERRVASRSSGDRDRSGGGVRARPVEDDPRSPPRLSPAAKSLRSTPSPRVRRGSRGGDSSGGESGSNRAKSGSLLNKI